LWEKNWTAVAKVRHPFSRFDHLSIFRSSAMIASRSMSFPTLLRRRAYLNECSGHFKAQPTTVVDQFAREWGFIPTVSHELSCIPEVQAFTKANGAAGKWDGEAREGFIVRTTISSPKIGHSQPMHRHTRPARQSFSKSSLTNRT
jgi:tRNA ligase